VAEPSGPADAENSTTESSTTETGTAETRTAETRTDRSHWNWLLILPIVVPLLTPLYNYDSPRLFGFPAFYWLQFSFILVGVTTTSIVYQMTKRR
jgi:hypothetical protein